MFVIWGAMHGFAIAFHRFWKRFNHPFPPVLAWISTFAFVNVTWVFFRAKTLDDATRVLNGMVDFHSILSHESATIPTYDLAWAGVQADKLLQILPASLVGQIPTYLAIIVGFVMIAQKNSMEMASGTIGVKKLIYGGILLSVAMYFTLSATSSVFLYFNF
jgi:hypothetical protein